MRLEFNNKSIIWLLMVGVLLSVASFPLSTAKALGLQTLGCENPGWFPTEFGLKDHHVFWHDGFYYLVSIYDPHENRFAYARTQDFCNWEDFTPIMTKRTPGEWDEIAIWAPFVYEEAGVYYMYYTGLNRDYVQSIMLATTTNPAEPDSWERQGMVFQPNHAGMLWDVHSWSDCRDPTVIKVQGVYYLYYTGRDQAGGIIGIASAESPLGPWQDWGAVIDPLPGIIMESPTVARTDGAYYLFYHQTGLGEFYRIGASPAGPWEEKIPFKPGWAHEIWQDIQGRWFTSYLTDKTVTISPLTWDYWFQPPRPVVGAQIHHLMAPMILR